MTNERRQTMTIDMERIEHVQRELQLNALTCRCLLRDLFWELKEGSHDAQQEVLQEVEHALKQWGALSSAAVGAWNAHAANNLGRRSEGGAS